jgi:preprotein translocase subunit Sss1
VMLDDVRRRLKTFLRECAKVIRRCKRHTFVPQWVPL